MTSPSTKYFSFSTRKLDLVVFGASGFTGRFVIKELVRLQEWITTELGHPLQWAAVGRSRSKVQAVLDEFHAGHIEVLEADVYDYSSLVNVAKQTHVLLNCVGPFRYYGGPVVQACVDTETNYCDITGEPEFIDRTFMAHHEEAQKANILVVPACGFDSMPADLGVLFTKAKMISANIIPAHIEMFLSIKSGQSGMCGHYATYESLVQGIGNHNALKLMRKTLTDRRPRTESITDIPLKLNHRPQFNKQIGCYTLPFPGADASVVRMGQECSSLLKLHDSLPPVYFNAYIAVKKWSSMVAIVFFGTLISKLAKFRIGRFFLLKFPGLFTFNMFTHNGPTPFQLKETTFSETFIGVGYTLNDDDVRDHVLRSNDPVEFKCARHAVQGRALDARMVTRVKGPEPGYVATPLFLIAAAVTILADKKPANLPAGVLSPSCAFFRSNINARLRSLGIEFNVVVEPTKLES